MYHAAAILWLGVGTCLVTWSRSMRNGSSSNSLLRVAGRATLTNRGSQILRGSERQSASPPGNDLALERVHDILDEMSRAKECAAKAANAAEDEDPEDEAAAETKAVRQ